MPRNWIAPTVALTLATMFPLAARADDDRKAYDKAFIKDAGEYSLAENDISRLARDNSNSEGVRHYAEIIIGGDKKLIDELESIAKDHGYHIPEKMGDKQHDTLDRLKRLKGEDFDVEYMSEQVADQQSMVDLFEKARHDCDDKNLREFADRKVDMLKEHKANADELYRKVKHKER